MYTNGRTPNFFRAQITVRIDGQTRHFGYVTGETARDCALKLDKRLIELGLDPINILRKQSGG